MTQNEKIHCVGCEGGLEPLATEEIQQRLQQLSGWQYDLENKRLHKTFEFKNYLRTMAFVNAVAWIANVEKHHPDLEVSYNRCVVNYQTHAVAGVTENDMICAQQVEALLD